MSDWRAPHQIAELYISAEPKVSRLLYDAVKAGFVRSRHPTGMDIPPEAIGGILWQHRASSGEPEGTLPPDLAVSAEDAATLFEGAVLSRQPKRRRGRPRNSGQFVIIDTTLIYEMHKLVLMGVSVRAAARDMAPLARGGNTTPDSAEERLRKKYRFKYG